MTAHDMKPNADADQANGGRRGFLAAGASLPFIIVGVFLVGWLADETGSLAAGQYYYAAVLLVGATAVLWQPGQKT